MRYRNQINKIHCAFCNSVMLRIHFVSTKSPRVWVLIENFHSDMPDIYIKHKETKERLIMAVFFKAYCAKNTKIKNVGKTSTSSVTP